MSQLATLPEFHPFSIVLSDTPSPEPLPPDSEQWQRVTEYQQTIEPQLAAHLRGDSQGWVNLLQAMGELRDWHEQSRELIASAVRDGVQRIGDHYPGYRQAHLQGALAEARVQARMQTLPPAACQVIEHCIEALLAQEEPTSAYQLHKIALADHDHRGNWQGALAITTITELTEGQAAPSVLVYRFGEHGGWTAHESVQAAEQALATWLAVQPTQGVTLEPARWANWVDSLDLHLVALTEALAALSPQDPAARERLLLEALHDLSVPVNPPRLLALAQVEELDRSLRLGEAAREWIGQLPASIAGQLAHLIGEYASALRDSEQRLRQDLPTRDSYVSIKVSDYLATHLDLSEPCSIVLDIPQSVSWVREPVAGSGAPGTPVRSVAKPSAQRTRLPLEALALGQIDAALADRLQFLKVEVSPLNHPQQAMLQTTLDGTWLRQMATELDVAGSYERLLADAHLRAGRFEASSATDDAILTRPYELLVQIQTLMAQAQRQLQPLGVGMAERARQACDNTAWRADGLDLVLRPAALKVFDQSTHSAGSHLAGITFIEDRASGTTLLYLPQAPDGQPFRQYDSLDSAVEGLEWLLLNGATLRYLCERALEGDPERLESLVNQGLRQGFRNFIEARTPWPAHLSLTRVQYLADWGLKVRDHRASSTSSTDLVFQAADQSRGQALQYIRMALGFVPFVGTALALADALEASIVAGNAFGQGDALAGLEAAESVFLSLVDALLDAGPGALAASASHTSLMATAKARQLRQGAIGQSRLRRLAGWAAQRADEGFRGYERAVNLTCSPRTEGRWRNVHREPSGDFILRAGKVYAVEWDDNLRTWRLSPTRLKHYRQPIALDEAGHWQTHGTLYGTLVDGGLRGGGNIQGYLADRLDPLWPEALRRLLPRWWTDAQFRRQQQLLDERNRLLAQLLEQEKALERALGSPDFRNMPAERISEDCEHIIDGSIRLYHTLERYRAQARGRRWSEATLEMSQCAATVCERTTMQIQFAHHQSDRLLHLGMEQRRAIWEKVAELKIPEAPAASIVMEIQRREKALRSTLKALLEQFDLIAGGLDRLHTWQSRMSSAGHRSDLHKGIEKVFRSFDPASIALARLELLLDLAPIHDLTSVSWRYACRLYNPVRERFDRVAQSSLTGESLTLQPQQRERLKAQLRETAQALIRVVRRLKVSYPEQLDPTFSERLLLELNALHDGLPKRRVTSSQAQPSRALARVFEGDGLLLVGEPVPGQPSMLTVPQVNHQPERWLRRPDNTWTRAQPQTQPPVSLPLAELTELARARLNGLPDLRQRLRRYTQQEVIPADLEDLYIGESQELDFRARQLAEADLNHGYTQLREDLIEQARRLREEGRQARIQACKASTKPTAGHLQYLVDQGEARIRILGGRQRSGNAGTRNWLQEYEILDSANQRPLSYAHFHYRDQDAAFEDFVAAHLKTPAQRRLGTAGPGEPPVWRGEISRTLAERLFRNVPA